MPVIPSIYSAVRYPAPDLLVTPACTLQAMMKPFPVAVAILLCLAVCAEAHFGRDMLAACNPQTQLKCGKKCVNFKKDPKNCGACNEKCKKTFACINAGCSCPPWRPQLCTDTCISVQTDPFNCGYCGNICPSGKCVKGACVGGDDACGPYSRRCAGKCRNVMTDSKYCGNCDTKCSGGTICKGGGCVCPPQKPNMCSYKCTNKMIDPLNCEWCGHDCTQKGKFPNAKCIQGECFASG
ncbi:hypothetical protein CHLNCDRAFT_136698 [Chlorella variabilis]|uniref:TNFR-Cys domain-containing protein n=1 Tax=Chlorella variabilis TaxID=554065 RepID=E1ZKV5_CHLVA|nr:hypothetical protein CHLNCDRAFT_136698 [Chlorella variabilis]EFN53447.1 hypothetical protein CHLNCDRAFT_136698 [Chlorella variabilis]|eukprot:XP_005845549.1 hypothetical protein CHLNCDRAFT_136698 [Chlorella variabilis]